MKVNLTIVNATDQTLYPAQASHLSISATSIAPGASALATGAFQQIGDLMKLTIDGQLSLYLNSAKSGTPFKVDVVTYGGDVTGFHTTAPDGYVLGYHLTPNPNSYIFDVTATAYPALTVDKDAHGYAIDLTSDPMNYAKTYPYVFADFINAMFNPKVRSTAVIETAGKAITNHWDADEAPPVFFADFTGGQLPNIVSMLKDYWLNGTTSACPAPDQVLIDTIKAFIKKQKPSIWLPVMSIHDAGPPQVFNLKGYKQIGFFKKASSDWSESTVASFLTLLVSGAHLVQICAKQDLKTIGKSYSSDGDFFQYFTSANIIRGNDLGSSHYVGSLEWNNAGWYFLDIDGEIMPGKVVAVPKGPELDTGLLDAFMVSGTVIDGDGGVTKGNYNAFLQSEGWQQQGLTGGDRHMGDLDTSKATAWNIGTLGASPYSEKRATTVFLAPDGWTPEVTAVTLMMPYVGAYAVQDGNKVEPQGWLNTSLALVDNPAKLKSEYILSD